MYSHSSSDIFLLDTGKEKKNNNNKKTSTFVTSYRFKIKVKKEFFFPLNVCWKLTSNDLVLLHNHLLYIDFHLFISDYYLIFFSI